MKKKSLFVLPIIFLLVMIRIASVDSVPYSITDPINDVSRYQNSALVSTGNFHDEIDIIGFEINSTSLIMSFDATPVFLTDYIYVMTIFWDGDSNSDNYTFAQFSGSDINQIATYLWNSQGVMVGLNFTVWSIAIVGNTLTAQIPDFALIQDILNPHYVAVHASYIELAGYNYYSDNLTDGDASTGPTTNGTPGYQIGLVISELSLMIMVRIYVRRNK